MRLCIIVVMMVWGDRVVKVIGYELGLLGNIVILDGPKSIGGGVA